MMIPLLQIVGADQVRAISLGNCPTAGVATELPIPGAREPVIAHKKKAWEAALGGERAAKPHIQSRLSGWPEHALADRGTLPHTDREFAQRVAGDTWRGLDAFTDRENGLPIDNIRLSRTTVDIADCRIGDYTSATDIGLHLIDIVAAHALQLLSRAAAIDKARRLLITVSQLESYHGFLFNFYDTTSKERTSNFISFVDSSWLTAGLIVVRQTFPELAHDSSALIARMDYSFFYDHTSHQVSHGYYVTPGARSPYDYGMLYTEARLGSLIAIGKGDVPETQWFHMARTLPETCPGQSLTPTATRRKRVRGHDFAAGYYEWKGTRYIPSWGGSMFEALMPTLVLDEQRYAASSLGRNDMAHAIVQRQYAIDQLGYRVWGMSPSAAPAGEIYGEYGVKVLGVRGYGAGTVTPHASGLALVVTPEAALANLRTLAELYDIYGEYGFYDAVDPRSGTVAYEYLALDQSMLFIALANYLDEGYVPKRFAADPIVQHVLPMIADEKFFE